MWGDHSGLKAHPPAELTGIAYGLLPFSHASRSFIIPQKSRLAVVDGSFAYLIGSNGLRTILYEIRIYVSSRRKIGL